jgi:hypothetical protein
VASNSKAGRWPVIISVTLFTIFVVTVLAGKASTLFDDSPRLFLGDVPEFLILFASVIAFVICVLCREAARDGSSS